MKVYIMTRYTYESSKILRVFAKQQDAEAALALLKEYGDSYYDYKVQEHEVVE